MADLDREPFWGKDKGWTAADELDTRKVRFEARGKTRSEVIPCDSGFTIEFLFALTFPQFEHAYIEQDWSEEEAYSQLTKCLHGDMKVAWEETLDKDYPDEADRTDANWVECKNKFVVRYLNCKRPRDVQLRHLEHKYSKNIDESPDVHFRRFKESLRHTLMLPAGVKANPSTEELKEWYFQTYCKKHRLSFLTSGHGKDDLSNSTMEEITDYMRLLHQADINDGTIARLKDNRRRNGSSTRNGSSKPYHSSARYSEKRDSERWDKRRDDFSPSRKSYRTSNGRHERRSSRRDDRRDDRRSTAGRGSSQGRRDDRRHDDRRDRRDRHDKSEYLRSDKRDCKVHRPCKHTWEECSQNPKNARKKVESHLQDDDDDDDASHGSKSRSRSNSLSRSRSRSKSYDSYEAHHVEHYHIDDQDGRIPRKRQYKKKSSKPARRRILEDSDSDVADNDVDHFAASDE